MLTNWADEKTDEMKAILFLGTLSSRITEFFDALSSFSSCSSTNTMLMSSFSGIFMSWTMSWVWPIV